MANVGKYTFRPMDAMGPMLKVGAWVILDPISHVGSMGTILGHYRSFRMAGCAGVNEYRQISMEILWVF